MKKFYVMGNYSAKAFQGFVKDPTQDRKKAVETILQATGGKIHSFDIVRGSVDFLAELENKNYDFYTRLVVIEKVYDERKQLRK